MFFIRVLFGMWGIIVLCGAIDSALSCFNDGRAPKPISYHAWNQKLFGK